MKKSFILLVGLFMSLGAEAFKDLPVVGNLDYSVDCGMSCQATSELPKISEKIYIDYVVFGDKGELTNNHELFEKLKRVSNPKEAETIITVRPIAINEKPTTGLLNKLFSDSKGGNWKLVSSNMEKKESNNGTITSAGVLTSNMSNAGMSNSAAAGAGIASMLLATNYPKASIVYQIQITNKNGEKFETYHFFEGKGTYFAIFEMKRSFEKSIK